MRISGLGYIDKNGVVQLHRNLVEGLSIYSGSILFGVYYPKSKNENDYAPNRPDFMLTPVPYRLWSRSARIIIRLKRQSKGLKLFTKVLADNNVTILNSISNRSAHRYSTWDAHIAFDDLNVDLLTWNAEKSIYNEVDGRLKDLIERILEIDDVGEVLFKDSDDISLNLSVRGRANSGLHYFYYITEKRRAIVDKKNKILFTPFSFRYSEGKIISNSGGKINSILHQANSEGHDLPLPTVAFIESDSHYLNIRIRLFPQSKLHKLFRVSIYYERRTTVFTTRGLTEYLVQHFPENWKLWKYWNQLYECRDDYGSGKLSFFIEDTYESVNYTETSKLKEITTFIDELNHSPDKPNELNNIIFRGEATLIFPNLIEKYFSRQRQDLQKPRFDIFICYSSCDIDYAKEIESILKRAGNNCFLSEKSIEGGTKFPEVIRDALLNSREFCVICSKKSLEREWVTTEWGAAWFLKMNITPIRVDVSDDQLPKRLADFQGVDFGSESISKFAKEVFSRRFQYLLNYDRHFYYGRK